MPASVNPNNPPQVSQPFLEIGGDGKWLNAVSLSWYQWFASKVGKILNAPISSAVPATSGAQGTPGQAAFDANFLYICVAQNTWRRVALTAF